MEKVKVYNLNIIRYEDDYKHRYDSGVYPEKTRSSTDYNYIIKKLSDYLIDYIYYDILPCKSEYDGKYGKYEDFENYVYDKYKLQDKNDVDKLIEDYLQGYYVDYLISYKIDVEEMVNHQTLDSLAGDIFKVNIK
jgi:hypothetical protein